MIDDPIIEVIQLPDGSLVIREIPFPPPPVIPWSRLRAPYPPGSLGCFQCGAVFQGTHECPMEHAS